jgi:hypothetical protein
MADKKKKEESRYSADKLLWIFSRTHLVRYIVWSLGIHVVVISLTSYAFIRDQMFPEAARARELAEKERLEREQKESAEMQVGKAYVEKAKEAYKQRLEAAKAAAETNAVGTNAVSDVVSTNAVAETTSPEEAARREFDAWARANNINTNLPSVQQILRDTPPDKLNTPVIREMISMPTEAEIPDEPEMAPGLGISLEDTNP